MKAVVSSLGLILVLCVLEGSWGTTWYVAPFPLGRDYNPGTEELPFATIQRGIDPSSDGDTVVVTEGIYFENIKFKGKDITLTGTDPLDAAVVANTIINGSQAGSVVTFSGAETEACVLSGFTISRGRGTAGGGICGGTGNVHTHATIQNNMITDNVAANHGGGLCCCDGTIQNNVIAGNIVPWRNGFGGGLCYCNGTIQNNLITCNHVYEDDFPGGYNGPGGGLYACNGIIRNNTITGNDAAPGGGLSGCRGAIRNCVIWRNYSTQLHDSSLPTYSCVEGGAGPGEGNISLDPMFVDFGGTWRNNNHRLQTKSPCIDAGKNEDWMWGALDLDGNPRIFRGIVDMGAYEFVPTDPTPPVITLLGDNPMTSEQGTPYVEPGYTAIDNVDGDITAKVVVTGSVNHNVPGTYTLYYDITDAAGNPAERQTRTVIVPRDTVAPVITLLGDNSISLEVGTPYVEPGYTASDNRDGDIAANVVVTGSVDHNVIGSYVLHYSVSDSSGNPAEEKIRTIRVALEVTPPIITLLGQTIMPWLLGTPYAEPGYTATDNYDGDITVNVMVTGSVDHTRMGTYTLRYNVSDSSGNPAEEKTRTVRVVLVVDLTPPVITLLGDNPVTLELGTPYVESGYEAMDDLDGDITLDVVTTGSVDPSVVGAYTICYNVCDWCGNPAEEKVRTVRVIETTPPVITLLGDNPLTLELGTLYVEPGCTAMDNYDGDITANVVVTGSVDHNTAGAYTLYYDVADSSGNPAQQVSRVVEVVQTAPFQVVEVGQEVGGTLQLSWNSVPGKAYMVWSCDDLAAGLWTNETPEPIPSAGEITTWTDPDTTARRKFYQIELK